MAGRLYSGILIYFHFINMSIKKNSSFSTAGFTLLEALIVIAIIGLMSVFYVANLRPDTLELLRMDSTRLAADIRYIRSMSASRAIYNNTFPTGGYGILFKNGDGSSSKSYYQLYAGSAGDIIKTVELSNVAFRLVDSNSRLLKEDAIDDQGFKNFRFVSENSVYTNDLVMSADGDYQIEIYYDFTKGTDDYYYIAKLNIGRKTADDFVWSNLATTYDTNTPVCGNGVVESGEACEPVADGVVNVNCLPVSAGNTLGCSFNSCGDGYILGSEECEYNGVDVGIQCGVGSFCYVCWAMSFLNNEDADPELENGCTNLSADGTTVFPSSCCGGAVPWDARVEPAYHCINCRRTTAICPTSCSDPLIRPED
jgi:prepilin-type N-terminal cleavage/methylation domain-containing protein